MTTLQRVRNMNIHKHTQNKKIDKDANILDIFKDVSDNNLLGRLEEVI